MSIPYQEKLNLSVIAAIDYEGNLKYMIFDGGLNAKDFVGFICMLVKEYKNNYPINDI